jgi:hypothetical protein
MDFIEPAPLPPPRLIRNDGWFPDIEMAHLRTALRLDGTVTEARLIDALLAAMMSVNADLDDWKTIQCQAGWQNLAAVPATRLQEQSIQCLRYQRAVYALTKALLTEQYRDIDHAAAGERHAERLQATIETDRREARWAIRDLLNAPRTMVALI